MKTTGTTAPFCAAVDWGTTGFRLWLLDETGVVLAERRSRQGMMASAETGFAQVLEKHLASIGAEPDLPVVICGMAGARQGWTEAPYADIPAGMGDLLTMAARVDHAARDVRILPGLAKRDADAPDVMRGEETQLLGLTLLQTDKGVSSSRLICMPGTHAKWAVLEAGRVTDFTTFLTGELFAVLAGHSVLKHSMPAAGATGVPGASFRSGVERGFAEAAQMSRMLFGLRASHLLGYSSEAENAERLSGLLIGLEIAAADIQYGRDMPLSLVAEGGLLALYTAAFDAVEWDIFQTADADELARSGLLEAARQWHGTGRNTQ